MLQKKKVLVFFGQCGQGVDICTATAALQIKQSAFKKSFNMQRN